MVTSETLRYLGIAFGGIGIGLLFGSAIVDALGSSRADAIEKFGLAFYALGLLHLVRSLGPQS